MKVYTNYYGASRDSGIGTRAQSAELNDVLIKNMLVELSALRSISGQDKDNEALMYLLKKEGNSILGLSYTEPVSSSGYNRAAPCGIQYVCDAGEMDYDQIGSIVNFAVFKKPDSALPAPLDMIPVNDSGYMFHNNPAALAQVIDALVKVALAEGSETALIVLPQGRNNEYTFARYTISEALGYLPKDLRRKISFFTSLPVSGENYDELTAFDTAGKYGANVVFCSADNYQKLKSRRRFIEANMDRPVQTGAFAEYVANDKEPSNFLKLTEQTIDGKLTYDSLNAAAQRVANGEAATVDELRARIKETEEEIKNKQNKLISLNDVLNKERKDHKYKIAKLEKENLDLTKRLNESEEARKKQKKDNDDPKGKNGRANSTISQTEKQKAATNPFSNVLVVVALIIILIVGIVGGWLISNAVSPKNDQVSFVETEAVKTTEQEQAVEAGQSAEAELISETEPNTETEPPTEVEPGTEAEPHTEAEPNTETEPPTEAGPNTEAEPNTEVESGTETEPPTDTDPATEQVLISETEPATEQDLTTETEPITEQKSDDESEPTNDSEPTTEPGSSDELNEESEQMTSTEPIDSDIKPSKLIIYTDLTKEGFEELFGKDFDVREFSGEVPDSEGINNSVVVFLIGEKEPADNTELDAKDDDVRVYSYIYEEEQDRYIISLNGSVIEDFAAELKVLAGSQQENVASEGNE